MNPTVLVTLAFVGFAALAPRLFETTVMLVIFGAVATLFIVLVFQVGKEAIEKPDAEGSLQHHFRKNAVKTIFSIGSVLGAAGFFIGLVLAVLGVEPTMANGTKLWLISGSLGIACMVCAWIAGGFPR
ncbi:MAG: hypothetical protein JJU24_08385 [Natronohydrobacter sp.]|nr:hypothetical protein [Natronohydrobacter sp.]